MLYQGRSVDCGMVREFSEEKRQEIFRTLDEIDNSEWKSFMEWCGSSAEEFGDWPERLNVSAYTRYVDEYQKKVLELNEMTRQQVNTVFENVAEIDARYAERMRECQEKIKEQIAMVNTMTEFMQSMTDGNPNMEVITKGSVNETRISLATENTMEQSLDGAENPEEQEISNSTEEKPGFFDFIRGNSVGMDSETGMNEIDKLHEIRFITNEQYRYFKNVINCVSCNRLPVSVVAEIRAQANKKYDEIINNNHILETYVNDETLMELEWDLDQLDARLGVNYIEDMRALMLEYGLTDEDSITFFLMTISMECQYGKYMLERRDEDKFAGLSYTYNTRGAGLIQLTGPDQREFLKYILERTEDEEEKDILNRYIENFVDIDPSEDNEIWDNPLDSLNEDEQDVQLLPVADYIAQNYPIESALWYWCVYKKAEIDGKLYSLNECIETDWNKVYNDDEYAEGDYKLMMFTGTQCAVNGSEFRARGIGRFFMSWNFITFSDVTYYDPDGGKHTDGSIILDYREDNSDPANRATRESFKPNGWDTSRLPFYNAHIEYFERLSLR